MEQAISIFAVLLGLAALMWGAQGAAWLMTAGYPLINVRPFNCRACLTFWLTWAFILCAAALFQTVTLRIVIDALIFAFINFFYIKSKITIYE